VILDALITDGERQSPSAMLAYWFDLRTHEFSVYPALLLNSIDVGEALLALGRDLAIDPVDFSRF